MPLLFTLTLVIAASVVASALITPPLYSLLLALVPDLPWPYSRVYNRVILLTTIVALFLARKSLHLQSLGTFIRGVPLRQQLKQLSLGLVVSASTALVALVWVVEAGTLRWADQGWPFLLEKFVLKALPTALVVSVLEEVLFRGVFFRVLREQWSFLWAAILSSFVYAFVHFIEPDRSFVFPGWSWNMGLSYLGHVLGRIFDPAILPALLCLTAVGVVLSLAVERSRSIASAIGLHAGWILAMKFAGYATDMAPGVEYPATVGRRYFLLLEPAIWGSVLLSGVLLYVATRQTGSERHA